MNGRGVSEVTPPESRLQGLQFATVATSLYFCRKFYHIFVARCK